MSQRKAKRFGHSNPRARKRRKPGNMWRQHAHKDTGSKWKPTRHACEMWTERIEPHKGMNVETAKRRLIATLEDPVTSRVPYRYAAAKWCRQHQPDGDRFKRSTGGRWYYHPKAIFIIDGSTSIVTVLPPTTDDLATMLVWKTMNTWVND